MKAEDWDKIRHFTIDEKTVSGRGAWGNPRKMDFQSLRTFDTLRHLCGTPFQLTSPAWSDGAGHSDDSYHYRGRADDFWTPELILFEGYDLICGQLEEMGISAKVGFGMYPDWTNRGFHFDDRAMRPGDNWKPGVRWIRIDSPKHGLPLGYHYNQTALDYIEHVRWEYKVQGVDQ